VVDHIMYSLGRGERVTQVTASMRSNGTHKSDQGAVWRDIAAKATRLMASSPTGAMSAIYERHASSVEEFARAFTWREGQCGVAFAIGGRILGLEIFDHPEVMRRFFQKLVRSYALDALDATPAANEAASVEAVSALVTQIGGAQSFTEQALGIGKDVRFNGPEICGAALWAHGIGGHLRLYQWASSPGGDAESENRCAKGANGQKLVLTSHQFSKKCHFRKLFFLKLILGRNRLRKRSRPLPKTLAGWDKNGTGFGREGPNTIIASTEDGDFGGQEPICRHSTHI
jgi:hypothetical protein